MNVKRNICPAAPLRVQGWDNTTVRCSLRKPPLELALSLKIVMKILSIPIFTTVTSIITCMPPHNPRDQAGPKAFLHWPLHVIIFLRGSLPTDEPHLPYFK